MIFTWGDPSSGLPPQNPTTALRLAQCWLRDLTYDALRVYLQEQVQQRGRYKISLELGPTVRSAQREQRGAMRPYAHPYYWAAFVYYGA
jgi:CHAT domain-containing protein